MGNEMAQIRRPRSDSILNPMGPHCSLTRTRHTLSLPHDSVQSLPQSKCLGTGVSFRFHKYPHLFPSYSPFHTLCWIFRMFFTQTFIWVTSILFFLSSNKSLENFSLSTLSKANLPKPCYSPNPLLVYLHT